ncbi:MAG TPA: DUF2934 domain-containing protein [Candidatus Sulfotelmatobacter sp.]|nr:DUF2934 domain-containing protein [Candidatus Sulfotelmatobacter sp.]
MAKPRFPKTSSEVKSNVTTPSTLPSLSDPKSGTSVGLAEAPAAGVTQTRQTEPKKAARKPEIVKTEGRANLVPINVEEEVRRLAYLMAERRGFEAGHEAEDWLAAEREVRQRYRQQSA